MHEAGAEANWNKGPPGRGEEGQSLTLLCVTCSKAQKHRRSLGVAEQLQTLSLQDQPADDPMDRIQRLFSYRPSGPGRFPEPEKEHFRERLAQIPSGTETMLLCRPKSPFFLFLHLFEL